MVPSTTIFGAMALGSWTMAIILSLLGLANMGSWMAVAFFSILWIISVVVL